MAEEAIPEEPVVTKAAPKPRAPRKPRTPKPEEKAEATPVVEEPVTEVVVEEVTVVENETVVAEDAPQRTSLDELQELFDNVDEEPEPEPVVPPLSVRGVVLAPGYWQGFEGPYGRINVFAWLGAFFAFAFFPVGFIFSLIGLSNAKAVPGDTFGKVLGWIGLVVSALAAAFLLLWLIMLPFSMLINGPVYPTFH